MDLTEGGRANHTKRTIGVRLGLTFLVQAAAGRGRGRRSLFDILNLFAHLLYQHF